MLRRIDDGLAACEKGLVVGMFAALVLILVFNIVTRNILQVSFQRLLEIAPALVLWLSLIGATLGLKYQRHIRLELMLRFCPPAARRWAGSITGLFGAAVMGLLCRASFGFVRNEIGIFGAWGWLSVIFPLFFALSCFRYVTLAVDGRRSGPDMSGGDPDTDQAAVQ